MSFLTDDSSIQGSKPIELYEFTNAIGVVTRYTSYYRDVVFGGFTYTARAALKRGQFAIVQGESNISEMTVELPVVDPIVQTYASNGVPPQRWLVKIQRLQQTSGLAELIWRGSVRQLEMGKGGDGVFTAVFRVPALSDDSLDTAIPKVLVSKLCQHVLYDSLCTKSRAANQVVTTIGTISGRTVTVASIGAFSSTDFIFGDFIHGPTNEWRTVVDQSGLTLVLDVPLPSSAIAGQSVTIARGCDKQVVTCRDKFSNVPNFGGMPQLITSNPFILDIRQVGGK